ncbi:MAG: hypothetical protein LBB61_04580 [Treponema sp.]|nr:hypothetical protein [Treponema sp.]
MQGSAETTVKAPGADGSGDFIGVYAFEANERKEAGDEAGIALSGVVQAPAGGTVSAGRKAVLKGDARGVFVNAPETEGRYAVCGTFLQSGAEGGYVDMIIERGSVTIPEA